MRSIRHGNNRRKHLGVSLPAGKLNKHKCPHSGSSRKGAARARRPVWTGVKDCHLNQCMALPVPTSCRAVINLRPLIWRRIDFKCAAVCDVELGRVVQVRSARGACAPCPTGTKRSRKSLQQSRPASEPANLSGENTPNAGVSSSISLCARAQFNTPITHPRLHPPDYQCTCGSHKQAKSVCHRGPSRAIFTSSSRQIWRDDDVKIARWSFQIMNCLPVCSLSSWKGSERGAMCIIIDSADVLEIRSHEKCTGHPRSTPTLV